MRISKAIFKAFILLYTVFLFSCREEPEVIDGVDPDADTDSLTYNPDWTFETHGKVDPNYEVVFPQNTVNKIEIVIGQNKWNAIKANMTALTGKDFGVGDGSGEISEDPEYVNVTVVKDGKGWKQAGFRLKGNSSLSSIWQAGLYKLPFRLNFDKFEDEYPALKNQRFYGFKELSFSPGYHDESLMREKLASDIFRLAGIPSPRTAFYRVYIDFGAGLKYCGVYTCVEVPDDSMIEDQFDEDEGNIYKPESRLSTFVESEFEKKNNEATPDFNDVKKFILALNNSIRTTNPPLWRAGLEGQFNVDHFLKYLAVNNTIVNWDSYGSIARNYYLYNHSSGKLTWIPWDNNESLKGSPGITGTPPTPAEEGKMRAMSLSMNEATTAWPLLNNIANDAAYMATYKIHMKTFVTDVFTEESMNAMIDRYHSMISPYVIGAEGEQPGYTLLTSSAFTASLTELKTHVRDRRTLVLGYVP